MQEPISDYLKREAHSSYWNYETEHPRPFVYFFYRLRMVSQAKDALRPNPIRPRMRNAGKAVIGACNTKNYSVLATVGGDRSQIKTAWPSLKSVK